MTASTPAARAIARLRLRHRIKIEKAVRLVRTSTTGSIRPACRSVGLSRCADFAEVTRVCDKRGIPRKHPWGTPLKFWKTQTPNPVDVMKPKKILR